MENLQIISDIYDFVVHRGANMYLLEIPLVKDLERKNEFENYVEKICTDTVYKTYDKKNLEYEVFFDKFRKKYFYDIVNKNKDIYKNCFIDYDDSYVKEISVANPSLVQNNEYFCFDDYSSNSINVCEGVRKEGEIDKRNNVLFFGNSTMFGYYVNDNETISSYLRNFNLKNYSIYNCATNNETLINMYNRIINFSIKEGDIVIIGCAPCILGELIDLFPVIKTKDYFLRKHEKENFVDAAHYTAYCHKNIAKIIFDKLHYLFERSFSVVDYNVNSLISEYKNELKKKNIVVDSTTTIGASVMSCNPFTVGHRYLVETGARMFDVFVVFLMQEGMNLIFDKEDCSNLVRIGVNDLENVIVVDMPEMFSYQTFWPEYNDLMLRHSKNFVGLNTYKLLDVVRQGFNKMNIDHFICGIETDDNITRQHITQAKYLFNQRGINVICIPRKKMTKGIKSISGTKCRELLKQHNYDELTGILQKSVVKYIIDNNLEIKEPIFVNRLMDVVKKIDEESTQEEKKNLGLIKVSSEDFFNFPSKMTKLLSTDDKEVLLSLMNDKKAYSIWAGYKYIMLYSDFDRKLFDIVFSKMKDSEIKYNLFQRWCVVKK
jgi:[citrate (pro-3S)-lyase] ligase